MNITKICFIALCVVFFAALNVNSFAIPNPWIDCGDDISCASQKAGFNLPLRLNRYSARAMDGMLEITFSLDKKRSVTMRKAVEYNVNSDISGVYENYPVNKTVTLKNGVIVNVRGKKNLFYVANFAASTGYYSAYSVQGMKINDIEYLYALIAEAEAPRYNNSEKESYSIEKLRELRTVDGIVEPVFSQDCFPRTLQKHGITKDCFERANLGQDSACTLSQIIMIKNYYKKGQKCDPLNGSEDFCAE